MEFSTFETLPRAVRAQIEDLTALWRARLGEALVGVYLHGSIALGRFSRRNSDIDVLIVIERKLSRAERLDIAREIIAIDGRPSHVELSAVERAVLRRWVHPTPCQFHYSEAWTALYRAALRGECAAHFLLDTDFADGDIACHVRLTKESGIRLYGEAIEAVFPDVPEADFWASISAEIDGYDFGTQSSRYFASNLLGLCRVLSYKREGRILSKYDAGVWAIAHTPEALRYLVSAALRAWYEGEALCSIATEDLEALRLHWLREIADS